MAWVTIAAGDVDAKSPVTDSLMGYVKGDLDWLKSAITDGASASQDLTVNDISAQDITVAGNLSVGTFFSSEQVLFLYW